MKFVKKPYFRPFFMGVTIFNYFVNRLHGKLFKHEMWDLCTQKCIFQHQNFYSFTFKKEKKLALVYLSHFRDHLGGHLGFQGEARGNCSAPEADLKRNILNNHKMKEKKTLYQNDLVSKKYKIKLFWSKPLLLPII